MAHLLHAFASLGRVQFCEALSNSPRPPAESHLEQADQGLVSFPPFLKGHQGTSPLPHQFPRLLLVSSSWLPTEYFGFFGLANAAGIILYASWDFGWESGDTRAHAGTPTCTCTAWAAEAARASTYSCYSANLRSFSRKFKGIKCQCLKKTPMSLQYRAPVSTSKCLRHVDALSTPLAPVLAEGLARIRLPHCQI